MPIKFYVDQAKDLSTFLVNGPMRLDELHEAIKRFYRNTYPPPTKNILCDFRNASVDEIQADEAEDLAFFATTIDKRKKIGRTAIVAPDNLVFSVSRIFGAFINDNAVEFEVLRDFDEAYSWVTENDE
jgi:hypothetical protein